MELLKWGDNLYELRIPFWTWSSKRLMAEAILKLQEEGKIVTAIHYYGWGDCYLICTALKERGLG